MSHNGAIGDIKPIKIISAPTFESNVKFSYSAWPYCNPCGKHVEAYGDSLLVVQQVASEFQI